MRFVSFTSSSFCNFVSRHFSSLPKLRQLRRIPSRYRSRAILQAQQVLTDYLHSTRSLSFDHAENISKNSLFSLSELISKVEFSPSNFFRNFQRFLRYHPINEIEFFFESIGVPPSEINGFLPSHEFFLSEEGNILKIAGALSVCGFPWNKLGTLYKEEISIFSRSPEALTAQLREFRAVGFDSIAVSGICLAFPFVLSGNDELSGEIDALFDDLKRVFLDFGLASSVEWSTDAWYEICKKIRVFYDIGCERGKMGELFGRRKNIFLEHTEGVLVQKVDYFCRFSVRREDVGLLLLQYPEILHYDLESPVISALDFLKHIGLSSEKLNSIAEQYPYVLGKNRLANVPHLMRAVNLHQWFFNKIMNGDHHLLINFVASDPDEDLEKEFKDSLARFLTPKAQNLTIGKLNFLLGIGFGENLTTIKALSRIHGSRAELQERFDCLLRLGVEFTKLCKMVNRWPKILNQNPDVIEQKVNFLCNDIGSSLQTLNAFPGYLCFDLENRIKPRFRIHMWLKQMGLVTKNYSIASIIADSEKKFIARLFNIHPAAPKQWLECFSCKNLGNSQQETTTT
ncbi:PREDICTED: transcription termination factor MTEF18, mitochondrial [Nelumbo nucifera]|uniref:Transcription termination factor MTEF18, mitochondrial-like n=2 Tax=Nelumbo nucifera TaxID=4432 RepID=A0A822XLM0_NELNU|nr:PREDICTED: transcription termination factor MTEF18, mitochondrial [Nelumbo nucifera]DAD18428.1 TPA_asm: hypothetical protein HUJ06_019891 [Nelumbo nucifera]